MTEQLKPCPLCAAELPRSKGYFIHPQNDCYLSGLKLSEHSQKDIEAWNRRTTRDAQAECGKSSGEAVYQLQMHNGSWLDVSLDAYESTEGDRRRIVYAAPQHSADIDAMRQIRQALEDYHFALDTRQHGGVAGARLVCQLEDALKLHWVEGHEAQRRAAIDAALQAKGVAE